MIWGEYEGFTHFRSHRPPLPEAGDGRTPAAPEIPGAPANSRRITHTFEYAT
jgi:hypothetical protein